MWSLYRMKSWIKKIQNFIERYFGDIDNTSVNPVFAVDSFGITAATGEVDITATAGAVDINAGDDVTIDAGGTGEIVVTSPTNITLTPTDNLVLTLAAIPTYADDAAAGAGGLTAGMVYKQATGELMIKL